MADRKPIPKMIEAEVLFECRRRCCLCFYYQNRDEVRRGQIAHLNHDRSDDRKVNLVYLCFEHHDEYDSTTSQSKGLNEAEVRRCRDMIYQHFYDTETHDPIPASAGGNDGGSEELDPLPPITVYRDVRCKFPDFAESLSRPWRFSFQPSADEMEYFAYLANNGCDGVCLIERIDLPDGRIVIVCIEPPGNPGQSITNAVQELAFQVCERFDIPPEKLVWLENYEGDKEEWNMVVFGQRPPLNPFEDPKWIPMTQEHWNSLWLRPMKRPLPPLSKFHYSSKLRKLF